MTEKVVGTSAVAEKADSPTQAAPEKRRALGRGLDSLLPSGPRVVPSSPAAPVPGVISELQAQAVRVEPGDEITKIKLDQIDENPYQTRVTFEPAALQELAESIRVNGVLQPIVVR